MRTFLKLLLFIIFTNVIFAANAQETWEEYVLEARIARLAGNYSAAVSHYEAALHLDIPNKDKVELWATLGTLFREMRDNEKALKSFENGFDVYETTNEGAEFLTFLYHQKCGWIYQNEKGEKLNTSEDCTYAKKNYEKYEKLSGKDMFSVYMWVSSFWDDDIHHRRSDFTILNDYSIGNRKLYFRERLFFDPAGKDGGVTFIFRNDQIRENFENNQEQFEKYEEFFEPAKVTVRISHFQGLSLQDFTEKLEANLQKTNSSRELIFQTISERPDSFFSPDQGIYFAKYKKNKPTIFGDEMFEEILVAKKGALFITIRGDYYTWLENDFSEAFELFLSENNLDLDNHFDSLLEARDRQLPFCLDQEKIIYGECVEPKFDSARGWGMFGSQQ